MAKVKCYLCDKQIEEDKTAYFSSSRSYCGFKLVACICPTHAIEMNAHFASRGGEGYGTPTVEGISIYDGWSAWAWVQEQLLKQGYPIVEVTCTIPTCQKKNNKGDSKCWWCQNKLSA